MANNANMSKWKNGKEVVLSAGRALRYTLDELRNDREVESVRQDGLALEFEGELIIFNIFLINIVFTDFAV